MPEAERDEMRLGVGTDWVASGKLAVLTEDTVRISGEEEMVSLPVGEVSKVELRKTDVAKSVILGLGIAVFVFGAFIGIVVATYDP